MNQRAHVTEMESIAIRHGLPRHYQSELHQRPQEDQSPQQKVVQTLSQLGRAMHEAELALGRLSRSEDDRAVLMASKAQALLVTCMDKFTDLLEK